MNAPKLPPPSRSEKQRIKSLHSKKGRRELGAFLVEGRKSVDELLRSDWPMAVVYANAECAYAWQQQAKRRAVPLVATEGSEVAGLSTLVNNEDAVAVAYEHTWPWRPISPNSLTLALDDIRDPGNLGTLLRLADWYGVTQVVCSVGCAEHVSPKVIAASMGSFLRVPVQVVDLPAWLADQAGVEIIGAVLDGESTHDLTRPLQGGVLIIGSESHGLSAEVESLLTRRISIPRFGAAESLNAGVAAGVLLDTWRRERQ